MLPHVIKATYVCGDSVWVLFDDGAEGEIGLSAELHGEVFQPLRHVDYFRGFTVHSEPRTLAWPNGADFAPEFLRSSLRVAA
jgi:Protein of unknown function (DUF2442)